MEHWRDGTPGVELVGVPKVGASVLGPNSQACLGLPAQEVGLIRACSMSHAMFRHSSLPFHDSRRLKWTTCALTGQPLRAPVVADWLGNLYSKESVLSFLLARAGSFDDEESVHRYANQLRLGAAAYEHLASLRCGSVERRGEEAHRKGRGSWRPDDEGRIFAQALA